MSVGVLTWLGNKSLICIQCQHKLQLFHAIGIGTAIIYYRYIFITIYIGKGTHS